MGLMSRVRGGVGRWLRGGVVDEMSASGGWTWLGGGPGMGAGRDVLRLPAVLCALRNLAEGVGQMPFNLYETVGEGRRIASGHPVHQVLHRPNPRLTAFRFKEWVLNSCCVYGNFYAEIERNRLGRVIGLWPIPAERVTLAGTVAEPVYKVRVPEASGGGAREVVLGAESVLHLRGYFAGGLLGLSLVREGAQALETAAAADGYAHKMFSQGMMPGGVLTHPGRLDQNAKRRMRESAELAVQGLGNAHRLLVLDEGEQFQMIGINPRDAQALDSRQYSVLEVARVFNVPPQRLYDLSRSTYNNAEQMGVEFVVYSLSPWCKRIEEEVDASLLGAAERGRFFSRFVQAGLLRGDLKTRHDAYKLALEAGWMTVNEVRALEEMNPVEGGDRLRVPLNFGDLGKLGEREEGKHFNAEARRCKGAEEGRGQGEGEEGPEDDGGGGGGGGLNAEGAEGAEDRGERLRQGEGEGRGRRGGGEEERKTGAGGQGTTEHTENTEGEEGRVSREWLAGRVVRAAGRLAVRDAWAGRLKSDADRVVRGELREVRKILEAGKRGKFNAETQRGAERRGGRLRQEEGEGQGAAGAEAGEGKSGGRGQGDIGARLEPGDPRGGRPGADGAREVRGLAEVLAGLRDYYGEEFKNFVIKMLAPALREFAAAMGEAAAKEAADLVEPGGEWNVDNFVEAVVKDIVEGRAGERLAVLERALASEGEDPLGEAEAVLDSWEEQGGEALAETGRSRLGEAVAIAVWASLGVKRKVWKANAGACPFCLRLDGNTAGIEETFVERGGELGDGAGGTMTVGHDAMAPPVHGGCSCFVVPG